MFFLRKLTTACAVLLMSLMSLQANAQLADKKTLTLEGATRIATAAEAEARKNNWNVVIAIVDDGGHLMLLRRIDGTQTGSIDVAIGKAKTSAAFKRPTKVFDDLAKNRPSVTTIAPDAVLLEGGVPIMVGGQLVGAVGVSGVTSQQDAQIAEAGIAALGM